MLTNKEKEFIKSKVKGFEITDDEIDAAERCLWWLDMDTDVESIIDNINNDYIAIMHTQSEYCAWYLDELHEAAVDVGTLHVLNKKELEQLV